MTADTAHRSRILVVEDAPEFLEMVSGALQKEGYVIHVSDPLRLRVEGKAGDRVVIVQGIDTGRKIVVRIGAVRVEARDFRRLWTRLDQELKG